MDGYSAGTGGNYDIPDTNDRQRPNTNDSQQHNTNDSQQPNTNDSQQPNTNDSQQPNTNDNQQHDTNDNQQHDTNDSPHHDTENIQKVNLEVKSRTASSSTSPISTLSDPMQDTIPETVYDSSTCLGLLTDPHKYLVRKTNSWPDKDSEDMAKLREDEQMLSHAESVCLGIPDNPHTLKEGSTTTAPDSERLSSVTTNLTSSPFTSAADVLKPFTSINQLVCCSFLSIFCCCYFGAVAFRNAREAKLSSRHGFPELARKEIRVASNNLALAIFVGGCAAFVVCLVVLMMLGFDVQLY
ncbi:bromodomain-containing protein DDB_G0270170-like [Physella acuta]|uniref:bromodomain-containing protein DDB_G0270170-like n=1 Tax=Physella acuta TaxID=109671 RepID=UPI0027DD7F3B|nr:bromodomain-containing protein DDB_G0270170-like [Physella acuta]